MAKFRLTGTTSVSTFYANQRLYVSPTVQQAFDQETSGVVQTPLKRDSDVMMCGDCQTDSPGFSATKGAWSDYDNFNIW